MIGREMMIDKVLIGREMLIDKVLIGRGHTKICMPYGSISKAS